MKETDFLNVDKKEFAGNAINILCFIFSLVAVSIYLITTFVIVSCTSKVGNMVYFDLGLLRFKIGNGWLIIVTFCIQFIFSLVGLMIALAAKANKSLKQFGIVGLIISSITLFLSFVTMTFRIFLE